MVLRSKWGPPHTPERWNIYSTLFHHSSLISFSLSGLHLSVRTACRTACSKTSASKASGTSAPPSVQRDGRVETLQTSHCKGTGGVGPGVAGDQKADSVGNLQGRKLGSPPVGPWESRRQPRIQASPHFEMFVLPRLLAVICSTLLPLPATNMVTWSFLAH